MYLESVRDFENFSYHDNTPIQVLMIYLLF